MTDAYKLRLEMSRRGWQSEDRVTGVGWSEGYGFSIWFYRYDWHGEVGDRKSFHAHSPDLDHIDETVTRAACLALQAWEDNK